MEFNSGVETEPRPQRHESVFEVNRHGCRFSGAGGLEARSRMLRAGRRLPSAA